MRNVFIFLILLLSLALGGCLQTPYMTGFLNGYTRTMMGYPPPARPQRQPLHCTSSTYGATTYTNCN